MMDVDPEGSLTIRLNGRTGREQTVRVESGKKRADVNVSPFGIVTERL